MSCWARSPRKASTTRSRAACSVTRRGASTRAAASRESWTSRAGTSTRSASWWGGPPALPEPVPRPAVDLTRVKPYADQLGDGIMQLSFTLPVPYGIAARRAAQELAVKMGLENPEVVHYQELTDGYTYFMMFGECTHAVDYTTLSDEGFDVEYMTEEEIESFAREHIGRAVVVVGASTGTDTHSVGIDAMLNLKGFH